MQFDSHRSKVVPIKSLAKKPVLHPRLEEIRSLLHDADFAHADPSQGTNLGLEYEQSDEAVIQFKYLFRRRFGPGFGWNPAQRKALIRLMQENGLTDPEIRLFRYSGNLKRTPFGVFLTANRWIALFGWIQLCYFCLLFSLLLVAATPNLIHAPGKILSVLPVLSGILFASYFQYLTYIKPWQIQRRVELALSRR